jgi:Flp pilus assembly protein CpaB
MVFRRAMPLSSKIFAVLATVLGTGAFLIVQAERERYAALRPAVGPPVSVVIVRAAMARGTVLTPASLDTRQVPRAFVPPAAVSSLDAMAGRVLAADLAAGDVITRTRLVEPRAGPLAGLVPEGMRAVAIATPVPSGLRPGDRVDVLATFGGEGRVYTETVGMALEVLRVLAPSRSIGGASGDAAPTLVVLSTPDVAEQLATASAFATVHIAVVGPEEGLVPPASSVSG